MVAMSLVVEKAIQTYQHLNNHEEWEKGGDLALDVLGLSSDEMLDICDDLHARFNVVQ
jgi:hypothetical protein